MSGLKELWSLGEPAPLAPDVSQLLEPEKQALLAALERLNSSLRFTAANAPLSSHEALSRERDQLLHSYQQILATGKVVSDALQPVIAQANGLCDEATNLAQATEILKNRWDQQAHLLESTEDAVAGQESDKVVREAQQQLHQSIEAANKRDYQSACDLLDQAANVTGQFTADVPGSPSASGDTVNERRVGPKAGLPEPPVVPSDPESLENWKNPLIEGDPRELFKADHMDEIVKMRFQGEASAEHPELNEAMNAVLRAGPEADEKELLEPFKKIAKLRGIEDPDGTIVSGQLDRFLQLKKVAGQLNDEPDEAWTSRREEYLDTYSDFLGTRNSLRYGQVVGEATGLDPAFASLLNPTGGMVGPGMDVLAPVDADSPVICHGIFHDAGGYLLNNQNSGPGYTYLEDRQPDSGQAGDHPFQGQVEGISYWYERMEPDRSVLEDVFLEPEFTAADPNHRLPAYERFIKHPVEDAERFADQLTDDAVNEVRELTGDTQQLSEQSFGDLKTASRDASQAVQETVDDADQAVDTMATTAKDLGIDTQLVDGTQDAIKAELQTVREKVASWEQEILADLDAANGAVEQSLQEIDQWAEEAAEFVKHSAGDYASDVKEAAKLKPLVQSKLIQEVGRRGVNLIFGDTQGEIESLVDLADQELKRAREIAEKFCDQAPASAAKHVDRATAELAVVKDDLIDKLAETQAKIKESAKQVSRQVNTVEIRLNNSAQDICDAAAGVEDSFSVAVADGTDFLSHSLGSATEFAAESLASLTNLLG